MASTHVSLVLSGGVALGAYQAGAYAALHKHKQLSPRHVAGSSIGAVNAALIAGSAPHRRIEQLENFWGTVPEPVAEAPWLAISAGRHASNWFSVVQTRLFGRRGWLQPRLPELMLTHVTSIYDLAPLRAKLAFFIDFDLLNSGSIRVSVTTTDLETGEAVVFDTARGDRIEPDHLLASCGFLPDFPPVEIGGRLLGDGGLVANAPVEAVLTELEGGGDHLCFLVDLFCPKGARPTTLEEAASRRWDLIFGNQTRQNLKALAREYRLRFALGRVAGRAPELSGDPTLASIMPKAAIPAVTLLHLSYVPPGHEAGPEKPFDFSRPTLADRWSAGTSDMAEAIRVGLRAGPPPSGISIHHVPG
jgi:NTE family protein